MTVTLTIDDAHAARIGEAFDAVYPGRSQLDPVPTRTQWVKRKLGDHIKEVTRAYETNRDADAARRAAADRVESEIVVT